MNSNNANTPSANAKEVLTLAVEIGDLLLRNGGEIYRVEDTILHILRAFDIERYDVYVLSNGIFASANENQPDACSIIRHVPLGAVNLNIIAELNQLSREIADRTLSLNEANLRLTAIKVTKGHPEWLLTVCTGIGSAGFCYLFGGGVVESILAFFIGMPLEVILNFLSKYKTSKFIKQIFGSAYVTLFSLICLVISPTLLFDKIIIGCIMPLVPGIALTTSIRDLFNGDYLSGTIHLLDAVLTAMCIAVGVGTIIGCYSLIYGVMP